MITQERLHELLDYDPLTGLFCWRSASGNRKTGWFGGSVNKAGYLRIFIDGKLQYAHRLAWLYIHGRFPIDQVDHINLVKSDNRIINLREVTCKQNQENKIHSSTQGAVLIKSTMKFAARVKHHGKMLSFGCYDQIEDAAKVAKQARVKLFTHLPK